MAGKVYQVTVQEVRDDTPSVYTLVVKAEEALHFEPGQFFFIYSTREGRKAAKAYSVASLPGQNILEFCIKRIDNGFMSNKLYKLKKGYKLEINGPFGFFTLQQPKRPLVFLATGTGIAALRPMINTLCKQGNKQEIHLLFGIRTQEDILYRKEFEELAKDHKNFHFIPVLSKEQWQGHHGHIQHVLWKVVKDSNADYYICGLAPMVDDVKRVLSVAGIPEEQIHLERYV
jgi:ferredoxin-NADP reductase